MTSTCGKIVAAILLAAGPSIAGWNPDLWPSWEHLRYSGASLGAVTGQTHQVEDAVTVEGTAPLPGYTNTFTLNVGGSVGLIGFAASGDPTYATTSTIYNAEVRPTPPAGITGDTHGTNLLNEFVATTNAWTNIFSATCSATVTRVKSSGYVAFTSALDAPDQRFIDAYNAMWERTRALNLKDLGGDWIQEPYPPSLGRDRVDYIMHYTAGEFARRRNVKGWVKDNTPYFFNIAADPPVAWTVTGLLAHVSAPTNWCEWPFEDNYPRMYQRDYELQTSMYSRVMSNSWTIFTTATGVVSQTAVDVWGYGHSISGTNGEIVSLEITQENILPGFTLADYGWKHFTDIMDHLIVTEGGVAWGIEDDSGKIAYGEDTEEDPGWSFATADADAATPIDTTYGTPRAITRGFAFWVESPPGVFTEYFDADKWAQDGDLVWSVPFTNIQHKAHIYLRGTTNGVDSTAPGYPVEWAAHGRTVDGSALTTNWQHEVTTGWITKPAGTNTVAAASASLTSHVWCDEPDADSPVYTFNGHILEGRALVEWDFKYK